jgi:hypothetical protein
MAYSLSYKCPERIWTKIMRVLLHSGRKFRRKGATDSTTTKRLGISTCAGVPTSNNADYAPQGLGELCYDSTNNDIYICSAYVSTTSHTWTKIFS